MTILKFRTRPDYERFFGPYYESEFPMNHSKSRIPATNIKKAEDNYEINMAAPGLKKTDFKISLEKNVLTISYEAIEENNENESLFNYLKREFRVEGFSRSFVLPESTQTEDISAKYENGILIVTVPFEIPEKNKIFKSIQVN
jgi:HSP20 family protein